MLGPRANGSFRYAPFYCEENVFHLAREPMFAGRRREVVFISNEKRACAIWHQRAAVRAGWPILWDYHVVLLCADPWEVYDLDTTLSMPCAAAEYLRKSFRPEAGEDLGPRFRIVEAGLFAQSFASDRSHMRTPEGSYVKAPPPWPPIGAPGAAPNLLSFIDMEAPFVGDVVELGALFSRIADA
jgi:hypothetical protein